MAEPQTPPPQDPVEPAGDAGPGRLGVLLAMAMFVFVIDTSLMNVSISAVVEDLDTTVSGVQSAVAIEALVSAAFILIGSKVGDLFGRRRAYVCGLLLYMSGALAMVFAQGLAAIIVFWAVIGGLGASLYLPAMQSLIHGNFEGKAQAKAYALSAPRPRSPPRSGHCSGGFLTTYLSWRVGFMLEAVIITVVLLGSRRLLHDVPYTGDPRRRRRSAPILAALAMGGLVLGILVWQEGGEAVGALLAAGLAATGALVYWLLRRRREGKPVLLDPYLFRSKLFSFGISQGDPPAARPGRAADRPADLPADGSRIQRDGGGPFSRAPLADDVRSRAAGREKGREAAAQQP